LLLLEHPMTLTSQTLRDLGVVLVVLADLAVDRTKRALRRIEPHLIPPPDLEVRSTAGARYTGILIVDQNEVLGGIVIRSGVTVERASNVPLAGRTRSSSWSSTSLARRPDDDEDEDCRLPGWAEDGRDSPWRR
jgi:hypothetical protein